MKKKRIPHRHVFPGGYSVDIEIVDMPVVEGTLRPDSLGEFDSMTCDRGRIRLWSGLTPEQRWTVLMHELLHALADAQSYVEESR